MEEEKYSYPLQYDIKEVLSNMTSATFEHKFAQRNGIFILNGSKKTLGEILSLFFWEDDDINEIQNEAYQKKNIYAFSGFTIDTEYEIDLADALSSIISKGEIGNYRIDTPKQISDAESKSKVYKSRLEYRKRKISKLQFLQEEIVDFDFYIKQNGRNNWQIEVDSMSSKDLTIIRDLYKKNLLTNKNISEIEIESLSTDKSILFLDKLRQEGLNKDWEFKDIKNLTLKRPKLSKQDEEDEEELSFDATDEEISGITRAILDGHNLREDPFVKKSESEGYIFTSMTYLFYNKKEPIAIQIKAEFKGKPKVFEVSILRSVEIHGINQTLNDINLGKERDIGIRREFWNNALDIFEKMRSK